jgi:hypothetical protein
MKSGVVVLVWVDVTLVVMDDSIALVVLKVEMGAGVGKHDAQQTDATDIEVSPRAMASSQ